MRLCSNLFSMTENGQSINSVLLNASSARLDPHGIMVCNGGSLPLHRQLDLKSISRSEYITQILARTDPYNPERYA